MNKPDTKRRSSGRITLSDVAKAAGVSPITASRALRGERDLLLQHLLALLVLGVLL